ncbi:MAG TPA: hypothetical protein GX707_10040 [Epulopiscium sp.]|nr:hypothetical protein [Candidatus Epulonipiscium sp.]
MDWFLDTFLPSFKNAKKKNITNKQAEIFEKYMENLNGYRYKKTSLGSIEEGKWGNKKVIFKKEATPPMYQYVYYVSIE